MKKILLPFMFVAAMAMIAVFAIPAPQPVMAAFNVDENGLGFVGKGDVQLALGWNNKQLQDGADSLVFALASVAETTWECSNTNNSNIQERSRTTTTEGLVSHVARERNQITGFILEGFSGEVMTSTEGNPLGSCPSGPWSFVEGSMETTASEGSELYVNGVLIE
jgi:hypothetical protein